MKNQTLRELREHLGLSQAEFGEAIGYGPDRIWQVENGRGSFPVLRWREIYKRYHRDLDELRISFDELMLGHRNEAAR